MNHRGGRLPVWVIAVVAWLGGDAWSADPGDVAKLVARRGGRIVELSGAVSQAGYGWRSGHPGQPTLILINWSPFPRLAEIDLSATLVTDRGASRLAGCRRWRALIFREPGSATRACPGPGRTAPLTSLRVGFTRVRGRGLGACGKLETLGLDGPQTSDTTLEKPCRIEQG
ncbi:MAG: hypothetical protein Ct9H300mP1_23230 [Planctomycetaceae bacterium]|nr:MAG: hypothetical protein Ct9H300mP1_23230 [Planctomycetaceae bacterium]